MKIVIKNLKPRNPLVALARQRRAGAFKRPNERQAAKRQVQVHLKEND